MEEKRSAMRSAKVACHRQAMLLCAIVDAN
jgi:hypothetical protein